MTRFTTPSRSITAAVAGVPVNINSIAWAVSTKEAPPRHRHPARRLLRHERSTYLLLSDRLRQSPNVSETRNQEGEDRLPLRATSPGNGTQGDFRKTKLSICGSDYHVALHNRWLAAAYLQKFRGTGWAWSPGLRAHWDWWNPSHHQCKLKATSILPKSVSMPCPAYCEANSQQILSLLPALVFGISRRLPLGP
jgi:hypothetical protein